MARLLINIIVVCTLCACNQRAPVDTSPPATKVIYVMPHSHEINLLSVDNFIPAHYNIELIEYDTLHPVMQITYSARRQTNDVFDWVDTVLRLPMSVQQCRMLKQLLYGEPSHFSSH